MGWPGISVLGCPLVHNLLYEQHQYEHNSFSFYLTKTAGEDGSALVFGGINEKYMAGGAQFKYYPLSHELYWMVDGDDVIFNGTSYKTGNIQYIIDTGTSVIAGPAKVIEKMTENFGPGKEKQIDCNTLDTQPDLNFKIGGDDYILKPRDYVLQVSQGGKQICIVGLIGLDLPAQLGEAFILGDSFIKTYYTHFDVEGERLGLARAR